MTLFELIELSDGLDIGDNTWDWGIYFDFTKDSDDPYDQCMEFMAKHIEVVKVNKDWYSPCKVCEFVVEYQKAFERFFNEENREGYRPKDYEKGNDPTVDEGFFEAYMAGVESLIAGNYCDSDYTKLLNYLSN